MKIFKESQSLAVLRAYGSYQWWIFGIYTVFGSPDGVNGADESESVSYILIQAVFIKYISGSVLYILDLFYILWFCIISSASSCFYKIHFWSSILPLKTMLILSLIFSFFVEKTLRLFLLLTSVGKYERIFRRVMKEGRK